MTDQNKSRLHRIYSIVLAVALCITGFLIMYGCIEIYLSGSKPFTPEAVATAFSAIAPPVYLCIGLIIGGLLLDGILPQKAKKLQAPKQPEVNLARLRRKLSLTGCKPEVRTRIEQEQRKRMLFRALTLFLLCFCGMAFLAYSANPANWHQSQINASMIRAAIGLGISLLPPLATAILASYGNPRSMEKESALIKEELASNPQAAAEKTEEALCKDPVPAVRWAILCIALAIMAYGFFAGGTNDVLTKAINICTECVGLG